MLGGIDMSTTARDREECVPAAISSARAPARISTVSTGRTVMDSTPQGPNERPRVHKLVCLPYRLRRSCDFNSANEENGEIEGVGVDGLHSSGKLDELGIGKGPIFWVDSADSQPCVGTVGNMQWMIKANGKLFHSGLPHMVSVFISPGSR